jgi:signal transduction histidine kinase
MARAMATSAATPSAQPGRALRRDTSRGVIGGVCAGIARYAGVDPLVVRVGFVATAAAGGLGLALYPLAWLAIPADRGAGSAGAARMLPARASVQVALGVGFLLLSMLLAFRELGIWFSDALVWPLVLVAAGGALLWRQSVGPPTAKPDEPPARRLPEPVEKVRRRAGVVSRTSLGVALVVAAGIAFLAATGALSAARDVVLAALVVAIVLGVIFAPWIVRLGRSLAAERAERVRSQERAEVAAHLHDSVLQTLALMQRHSDDPREVASLARRQERELRSWLAGRPPPGEVARLGPALEAAAAEVEELHGVQVEVVSVGERELDPAAEAVVAAAREAMTNAAKFGGSPIDVYAEADDGGIQVFVRDRGPGFHPADVPADRRGVRESIVGRMERHGGRAHIISSPDSGTEVELTLEGP